MNRCWDAMLTAAEYILEVNRLVTSMPGGQVATAGRIHIGAGYGQWRERALEDRA